MALIRLKSTGKMFLEAGDVLVKIAEFQHCVLELGTMDPLYNATMPQASTQELDAGYEPQQSALYEMD